MTKIGNPPPKTTAAQSTQAPKAAPKQTAPQPSAEEKESSYEPNRPKTISTTGKFKATPIAATAKSAELAAEVMKVRGYVSSGGGKTAASSPLKVTTGTDGQVTIQGTKGNDTIKVEPRKDGKPGVDVCSGGQRISLSEDEAKKLTIDAGAGNDKILVDPKVTYDLTLKGGSGDDLIRGGGGNDTIRGGEGRDMIYGGEGDDKLYGEGGADMIQGNGGDDLVSGGAGNDLLYGGAGDDTVSGGSGKNVVAGGAGKNTYARGTGDDTVYAQKGDAVKREKGTTGGTVNRIDAKADGAKPAGHTIKIEGSAQFKAKVEAELDALRATPTGRALLEDIDSHPDKPVVIKEGKLDQSLPDNEADSMKKGEKVKNTTGTGKGSGSTVTFNPDAYRVGGLEQDTAPADADDPLTMPPTVALFHELVHSARSQVGESAGLVKREEYETAGTKDDPMDENKRYDWKFTENKLRTELGLPERVHYDE